MRSSGGPDDLNAALSEANATGWLFTRGVITFEQALKTLRADQASLHAQNWAVPESVLLQVESRLGFAYIDWGDIERGYPLVVRARAVAVPAPLDQWWHRINLLEALMLSDHANEAPALARETLSIGRQFQKGNELRYSYYPLVIALVHAQRYAEAAAALAEYDAMPGAAEGLVADAQERVTPHEARLLVALERGDPQAVVDMTDRLEPKDATHEDEVAWLARAAALCAAGRSAEGLALFGEWLPRVATDRYEASPKVAYWRARMGLCALHSGHRQQALEASALATAAIVQQPGVSAHFKAPVLALDRELKKSRS
jgi:tetratricopeptide (TPR) repeat protein